MRKTLALLSLLLVSGVGAATAAAADEIPRTPNGKPDFTGRYDIRSLTPFERRPERGEELVLSPEEAAEVEAAQVQRVLAGDADSSPDRPPPEKGAFIDSQSYNYAWFDPGHTMFQIDGRYRTSILTNPSNGRMPPLTEEAQKRRGALPRFIWMNDDGTAWWLESGDTPFDSPETMVLGVRCIYQPGASIPIRTISYNNLKTLVQTDDYLMIHIEWMHWTRVVRIDSKHSPAAYRSYSGDSIGRWEGDTLVVETKNFRREAAPQMLHGRESAGVPRGAMKVVERFSPIDGQSLLYQFEVEDEEYTAPFGGEMPWPKTDQYNYEYACHEGNYSMLGQLRGARQLEKEWIAAGKPVKGVAGE